MINLILVITTPSQTTTIHSSFSNRTLVVWVMNLQFGDGHLAEKACLCSTASAWWDDEYLKPRALPSTDG